MLRPIDIQNKEFEKKIKGYNPDQVDDFLDKVITDYEAVIKENKSLKEKLEVNSTDIERYKKIEKTLDAAVVTARETAAGIIENAKAESENIIRRAKLDAQNLEKQIDQEHIKRQQEIAAMNTELDAYKVRLKALCRSMEELIDKV
ncbi:MAG: DivIVA domain-containing protein [bacterium]|nr:DivIVA domain-containing protein [bacterium]